MNEFRRMASRLRGDPLLASERRILEWLQAEHTSLDPMRFEGVQLSFGSVASGTELNSLRCYRALVRLEARGLIFWKYDWMMNRDFYGLTKEGLEFDD